MVGAVYFFFVLEYMKTANSINELAVFIIAQNSAIVASRIAHR